MAYSAELPLPLKGLLAVVCRFPLTPLLRLFLHLSVQTPLPNHRRTDSVAVFVLICCLFTCPYLRNAGWSLWLVCFTMLRWPRCDASKQYAATLLSESDNCGSPSRPLTLCKRAGALCVCRVQGFQSKHTTRLSSNYHEPGISETALRIGLLCSSLPTGCVPAAIDPIVAYVARCKQI